MTDNYYKYKKYKKLYKKQKLTIGGTHNCDDITKTQNETDDNWETRCRGNPLCVINNKPRKCQVNPNNITININEMTGESYQIMIYSPYTVEILVKMLPLEKRRCKLFRGGFEDQLTMNDELSDGEVIFMLPNSPVTPIMDRVALRRLVEIWCQGGFTDELLDTYGYIGEWDVGNVTDMNRVFNDGDMDTHLNITNTFNDDISNWNVSNVTTMIWMFSRASSFNQPLDSWNVSNVTMIGSMFDNASSFNQPLDSWNVSNVAYMSSMFKDASSFNQPLDSWNVSNVIDMAGMFYGASSFNQPLRSWNVSNVTNMGDMFNRARSFNQPLDSWNVINVTYMRQLFNYADNFDHNNAPWYNF